MKRLRPWLIVLCGAFFYCYQFVIRVSPNVIHDDIISTFNIDETMFGFIIGLYYWGYSTMQLPLGIAMDRLGPKRIIIVAIIICALSCYIFTITQNIIIISICRISMGLGAASGFMGSLKLGSLWLSPRKMGIVTAIVMAFGTFGASIGGTPFKLLCNSIGWKNAYKILTLTGLLLSLLTYFVVKKKTISKLYQGDEIKSRNLLGGLTIIVKSYQSWLIAIFGALMYMPITLLGIAWGIPLLKSIYSISEIKAAPITTSMFIGAALGSPFFALLSDYLASRKIPMLIGGICCLIVWVVIIFCYVPMFLMYILFFLSGFFYTAKILTFASNCERQSVENSAITVGFTNMIVMIMGAFSHPIVGSLLEYKIKKLTFWDINAYRFALSIVPISLFLGIIILLFIKETYPARKI